MIHRIVEDGSQTACGRAVAGLVAVQFEAARAEFTLRHPEIMACQICWPDAALPVCRLCYGGTP